MYTCMYTYIIIHKYTSGNNKSLNSLQAKSKSLYLLLFSPLKNTNLFMAWYSMVCMYIYMYIYVCIHVYN